jgi:hypothetical protein
MTDAKMRELSRVAFDSLPLELAMKKVKGNGQRRLAIFSDADCPFCARLETELKNIDNVTIYTFLYPIDQLHPDAARKSKMIWCAPDKVKAWDAFFASGALPDNKGDCDDAARGHARPRPEAQGQRDADDGLRRRQRGARSASGTAPRGPRSPTASCRRRVSPRPGKNRQFRSATYQKEHAMAIIDFLKKQFIDIIEWTDDSRDTLSFRFPDEDKEIKKGAQLIVRESQVAQFVYLGEFGDTFGPGKHTLTTDNIPILTNLKSWKYALESPFKADVYYVVTPRVHGQQVGYRQSGDDARCGFRRRAAARLRHLRFPHRRPEEIPEGSRRHRRSLPPGRVRRRRCARGSSACSPTRSPARRFRRWTWRPAIPSWGERCCRSSIRRSPPSTASR